MATIYQRENKNGPPSYRVQIRRKALKFFSATFPTKEQAEKFIKEFEEKYALQQVHENDFERIIQKRKNEFHRVGS